MKTRFERKWFPRLLAVGLFAILIPACAGPTGDAGKAGKDAKPCDVSDNGDGTRTIECEDGTAVTIADGKDGLDGGKGDKGDAGNTGATGGDGTPGTPGAYGLPGTAGTNGADGTSCSVVDNNDGTKTISCSDGTEVVVNDGTDAIDVLDITLDRYEDLPGAVVTIMAVTGGTEAGDNFKVGDTVYVQFKVATKAGVLIPLNQLNSGGIMLSGPTNNYQRVIARQTNLLTRSTPNIDGSYTYAFASTIPATYLAPLNDSASFNADHGELKGQALVSGTYTVGIDAYKTYIVDGASVRDAGAATKDVLLGVGGTLSSREVVANANCNQCHSEIQAHGGGRKDVKLCVLCHTAGSEDKNVSSIEGGTPGVSVDFGVMVHSIHNASHLPSVLGVTTGTEGERYYTGAGTPLKYSAYYLVDFSGFSFPVMPSGYVAYLYDTDGTTYTGTGGNGPMPRDEGYSLLTRTAKYKEDKMRTGVVACATCHGDPDGVGALAAPAQGDLHKTEPTRKACGSCHTDVNWNHKYVANGDTMLPQANDTLCAACHQASGNGLAVQNAHTHPWSNPALNPGLNINILATGDGDFAAGEAVPMSFSVTNNAGTNVSLHAITRFQFMLVGPTENPQVVAPAVIPFDTGFRKSSPFTGTGSASKPSFGGGAIVQTIGVIFTSGTAFTVTGTTTPPADFTIGAVSGNTTAVTFAGLTFTVTQGATQFAAGDRFYFEALPTAASYAMNLPMDVTYELLGYAAGASAVTYSVGNLPLYWGRQTVWQAGVAGAVADLIEDAEIMDRLVVTDNQVAGLLVNDVVVIDAGLPTEEYLKIGRIQTGSDYFPFLDFLTDNRIYFSTALRFKHEAGGTIAKASMTAKREGVHYEVSNAATGEIVLLEGAFGTQAPVVVSYRTDARFGWKRSASDTLQDVFQPAAADAPEIGQEAGDWKGLQLLAGTYTLGAWAHKDFSVTTAGVLSGTTRNWDDITVDDTTYRTITPAATAKMLYGGADKIKPRTIISSPANCETCHENLQAHGNGRMGLETCLMCHTNSGLEDGPRYSFNSWYTPATPGVSMDFRSLIHKVHMGKELAKKDEFEMVGVFLGKPYTVTLEDKGFPSMPGGAKDCAKCHGASNTAWEEPADREHPQQSVSVLKWTSTCSSCHDSDTAAAHYEAQTSDGEESCAVCHGKGKEFNVKVSHKIR